MIFVTGDAHGSPIAQLSYTRNPRMKNLTEDDFVIFLGDFGVLWTNKPNANEKYVLNWLDSKPWTSLVIGGNHENWDRLSSLETVEMFGVTLGKISEKVFFIPNGTILNIDGKSLFCMGGGLSIDKDWRLAIMAQHPDNDPIWWEAEIPSKEQMDFATRNLASVDYKVDYILTHAIPMEALKIYEYQYGQSYKLVDPMANFLQFIANQTKRKGWFCGHMHVDQMLGSVRCCYKDAINIESCDNLFEIAQD